MKRPVGIRRTGKAVAGPAIRCPTLLHRMLARIRPKSPARERQATLSHIDWVIEMLHRVREEKPEATAQWWLSLKRAVLSESQQKRHNHSNDRRDDAGK